MEESCFSDFKQWFNNIFLEPKTIISDADTRNHRILKLEKNTNTNRDKRLSKKPYNINMAQHNTELKVLLQFPYPVIKIIWMKQVISKTREKPNSLEVG